MPSDSTGFQSQYFQGQTLAPSNLLLTRIDSLINFNWGQGSPDAKVSSDNFSARWTGQIQAPTSGSYTFTTTSDDGARLWVNGQQLVNNWTDHSSTDNTGTIVLQAGQKYDIKMEYYEKGGDATATLKWTRPDGMTEFVPSATGSVASGTVNLSSLNWMSATNGWGGVEKNSSNGENGSGDGRTITLNGKTYDSGLGVHATSEVVYNLSGQYNQFTSDIGVDDEVGNNGSVTFQVWADGSKLYDSGTMRGDSATKAVKVDVTGKQQLKLVVTDAGDGAGQDHADWAGAKLVSGSGGSGGSGGIPTGGTGLTAQYYNSTDLATGLALTQTVSTVNFNWGQGSPDTKVRSDNFSARFTGTFKVTTAGNYTFATVADDNTRIIVDGQRIIDDWGNGHGADRREGSISLTPGTHNFELDYREFGGDASVRLEGSGPGYSNQILPSSFFMPLAATVPVDLAPYDSIVNSPNDAKPDGVPSYYSWYTSAAQPGWGNSPRTDWNAVTAWGQLYAVEGWHPEQAPNTRVQLRNDQLWILSKSTGQWSQTQLSGIQGGAFASDFGNNGATGVTTKDESSNEGGLSVTAGNGFNYHFWPGQRATMNPTDIAGVYSVFQGRLILDNANGPDDRSQAHYIASGGADYWRSVDAPFANDWSNNGGVGGGRFKTVTNDWQSFSFTTLTPEQLLNNPPPVPGVRLTA